MSCNCKSAGKIYGNPLCGLNERVCLSAKRVYDGCIARYANVELTVALSDVTEGLTPPYVFTQMTSAGNTTISALTVTPLGGKRSRVTFNATTPVTVTFTDSAGASGSGSGTVTVARDVVMELPRSSAVPYVIEAATSIESQRGSFAADDSTVTVTGCIMQIVRAAATVDVLVPSYGYCEYPPCEDYGESACRGMLTRPVFPPTD